MIWFLPSPAGLQLRPPALETWRPACTTRSRLHTRSSLASWPLTAPHCRSLHQECSPQPAVSKCALGSLRPLQRVHEVRTIFIMALICLLFSNECIKSQNFNDVVLDSTLQLTFKKLNHLSSFSVYQTRISIII